jgi:hypothetical protein
MARRRIEDYGEQKKRSAWTEEDRLRATLGQLRSLAGKRYGAEGLSAKQRGRNFCLENDAEDRAFLYALIASGLTGPEARKIAPWSVRTGEYDAMAREVDLKGPRYFTPQHFGSIVNLLDEESQRAHQHVRSDLERLPRAAPGLARDAAPVP